MSKDKKSEKKIAKRIEKELHECKKLLEKGIKAQKEQDLKEALDYFQSAYDIIQEILNANDFVESKYADTREGKIVTLIHLGSIHQELKETDSALEYLKDALKLDEEKGNTGNMRKRVLIKNMIGDVYCDQGEYNEAVGCFEELYYLMVRSNAPFNPTMMLINKLTTICYEHLEKDDPRTAKFFEKSVDFHKIKGLKRGGRNMLNNLAVYHYRNDNFDKALEYYQQTFELDEQLKDIRGKTARLRYIGLVYSRKENWEQALKHYNESLKLSDEIEDSAGKKETLKKLSDLYIAQGDEEKAQEYLKEAENVYVDNR